MSISESTADLGKAGQDVKVSPRSKEDLEELAKLDKIFERIRNSVPTEPYILSTPTDFPYHRIDDQERRSWMIGHLFEPREEYLQYGTWQYRDRNETVYQLRSAIDERMQKEAAMAFSRDHLKARVSTTPAHGAKKKISYSDYKAKQANGALGTPLSKKPSPEFDPVQPQQAQKPQTNGTKPIVNGHPTPVQAPVQSGQKRSLENSQDSIRSVKKHDKDAPPAAKKARPASPPATQHSKSSSNASNQSNSTPHGLPPLLSPTSLPNPYGLPPILSPTLPSNIQAELHRLEVEARKRADSNASSSSDIKSQHLTVPDLKSQKSDESLKGVARKVFKNGEVKSQGEPSEPKAATPTPVRNYGQQELPKQSPSKANKALIAKLKYPRKYRKEVERILRLPPTSKTIAEKKERAQERAEKKERAEKHGLAEMLRERTAKSKRDQEERVKAEDKAKQEAKEKAFRSIKPSTSASASIITSDTTLARSTKRPRPVDDITHSVPAKRVKAPAALEVDKRPSTPSDQTIPSPALTNVSSAQKSQLITPRKDLQMSRVASSSGNDITPGRGSTPSGLTKSATTEGKAPPLVPLSSSGRQRAQDWNEFNKRAINVGRELKHTATDIEETLKDLNDNDKEAAATRLAVMSIECILCFMIGFHATDASQNIQGKPVNIGYTWRTLLTLILSFKTRTTPFPHLEGIRLTLAYVVATRVAAQQSRAKHDFPPSEIGAEFRALRTDIAQLLHFAAESSTALSVDDLMTHFPQTWQGRSRDKLVLDLKREYVSCADLRGPYWAPVGVATAPIYGARFGLAFLKEWIAGQHGFAYALRVEGLFHEKGAEAAAH